MLQAKIYIDTRRKAKEGFPVKLQIYCTKTRKRKYIPLKEYQKSKSKHSTTAQEALSKLLLRLQPLQDLTLDEAWPLLDKESNLEILAMRNKLEKYEMFIDFYDFAEKLIKEKEIGRLSTTAFKAAVREVKNFMGEKKFGLNDITYEWVNNYRLHKIQSGTNEGGISYYLRTLKTIHNEAKKRESLGVKDTNPFNGLIKNTTSTEHQSKAWKIEDIRKLNKKFNHPKATEATLENMRRAIDMFLFQLAIGGHDFVDIANLRWSNIKDGRIVFKRFKNRNKQYGGREVNNMLNDLATSVIEKHGVKDSERIFSFLPDPTTIKYTHRNYAATLRRISKALKIKPHLTTKTPRYVFRTIAGNLLIHDLVVESLLGHKPSSISYKYQKGIPHEIQDKEHQKILDELFLTGIDKLVKEGKWIMEM